MSEKNIKDYLNSEETFQVMKISKLLDELEFVLDTWKKRGNINAAEHKDFKMAHTWGLKGLELLINRMNMKTKKSFVKRIEKLYLRYVDGFEEKKLQDRLQSKIDDLYNKDEHFYDLCELVMDRHCLGCTKRECKCDLADFFINNLVAEPYLEHFEGKHCRYAYLLPDNMMQKRSLEDENI